VNHLTDAAIEVEPRLAQWRQRIAEAAGEEPVLAGSGATWFLHGHHPGIAPALPGASVITTNTRPA
jgi:4-diphosphocytidyl-2-C-methyl-D-erythritol kinase